MTAWTQINPNLLYCWFTVFYYRYPLAKNSLLTHSLNLLMSGIEHGPSYYLHTLPCHPECSVEIFITLFHPESSFALTLWWALQQQKEVNSTGKAPKRKSTKQNRLTDFLCQQTQAVRGRGRRRRRHTNMMPSGVNCVQSNKDT